MGHMTLPNQYRAHSYISLSAKDALALALPSHCRLCKARIEWDMLSPHHTPSPLGEFSFESRDHTPLHSRMVPPGTILCECWTEWRNRWDLAFAGCERLIDRWTT